MDLRTLQTDPDLRRDGAWVEIFPGVRFRIRPSSHHAYISTVSKLRRRHQRELAALERAQADNMATEEDNQRHEEILLPIVAKAASLSLITDWDGVDEDGVPIPFSPAKVEEYLLASRVVMQRVSEAASDEMLYLRAKLENAAGNSASASPGSSGRTARRASEPSQQESAQAA